jgi:hypothetical protein
MEIIKSKILKKHNFPILVKLRQEVLNLQLVLQHELQATKYVKVTLEFL